MKLTIKEYLSADGRSYFREWLDSLLSKLKPEFRQGFSVLKWATSVITSPLAAACGKRA